MWLAEALDADVLRFRDATRPRLSAYACVIVCSWTFGGRLPLTGLLREHQDVLRDKGVISVCSTAVSSLQALANARMQHVIRCLPSINLDFLVPVAKRRDESKA
jgi:hypothetical protein